MPVELTVKFCLRNSNGDCIIQKAEVFCHYACWLQLLYFFLHALYIHGCDSMHSRSKKIESNTPINCNADYRREMKLISINMDYCLLQVDELKFSLGVRLHGGGSLPNFHFFNVDTQISKWNHKVHHSNCIQIFTTFLTLFWEFSDARIITNANF